jgi:hypothetical protein
LANSNEITDENIPLVMFNKNSDRAFLSEIFYRNSNEICSAGNFQ